MNDICFIKLTGGSGHSFLSSLILHSLSNDPAAIQFPEIGHSHYYVGKFAKSYFHSQSVQNKLCFNKINKKKLTWDPSIWVDDLNELLTTYPESDAIIIFEKNSEKLRLEYNHFYKTQSFGEIGTSFLRDLYKNISIKRNNVDNYYWNLYLKESEINSKIRSGLNSFADLTPEEVKELLLASVTKKKSSLSSLSEVERLNYWDSFKKLYPNRIHILKYNDLLTSMDTTISLVEEITKIPRTDALIESYNNYIERQTEFANKYMPWLSE